MILVILGTQDKPFVRLLEAVDREIKKGVIKDKVIVQAGQTEYHSDNMEIFDLLPAPEFEKLIKKANLIITHGGVGTILSGIKNKKKIIAVPRRAEFKEHHNDHQMQIVNEFSKEGYIIELKDLNKLEEAIKNSEKFVPKRFESNTNNMIKLIENYIEDTNNISWLNRRGLLVLFLIIILIISLVIII